MHITDLKAGDLGTAACPRCGHTVQTRYEYRTVQMKGTRVNVPDVLVAVCTECDHTAVIPQQSVEQLREVGAAK